MDKCSDNFFCTPGTVYPLLVVSAASSSSVSFEILIDHDYLFLLKDISAEEESMKAMAKMRKETMDTAQQVIDKQMRVAQEIASLLGETTGETKAALLKLKASVAQGDEP